MINRVQDKKFGQHADKSLRIGLIQRGIHFIQHAKWAGAAAEDRQQQMPRK